MLLIVLCALSMIGVLLWVVPRSFRPGDAIPPQLDAIADFTRAAPSVVAFELRITNEGREPVHVLGYTVVQGAAHGKHRITVPERPAVLEGADAAGRVHAELRIPPHPEGEATRPSATLHGRLTVTSEVVNMLHFTVFVPHHARGQERDSLTIWVGIGHEGGSASAAETWLAAKLGGR